MEKGGGDDPATRAAGGMCDRFLTFLARNLTMSRVKSIADGPKAGADDGGAGQAPSQGGKEGEEEDEFVIPIERAEFDYEFDGGHGEGGYSSVATILEESTATTTTTTRDVPEPNTGVAAAAVDGPVVPTPPEAPTAPAVAVVEEKKVRKSVTIKEDRPAEQEGGPPAAPLERKRSLFKKRQASSSAAGDEQRVPRRSGLRPRMPPVLRVPSNINERSSTFIEERKKSFVGRGGAKPAPADK